MTQQSLTVPEVLSYANHDFVNHLHLIGMHLDLNHVAKAKELIEKISTDYRSFSLLNKIGLPKTIEWLQTMKWRFSAFDVAFSVQVIEPLAERFDQSLMLYLEKTMLHVNEIVDVYTEQHVQIDIAGGAEYFEISLLFTGQFDELPHLNTDWKDVHIETVALSETMWHVIWRDRE